jgi:imidazolonepropionase-like amidohydrolase
VNSYWAPKSFALAVTLLLGICACAQTTPPSPAKRVVVWAGHMLDVKTGRMLSDQTIVIEGDKIVSVGGSPPNADGASVINLPNATVLPGLIDSHDHLTDSPRDFNFGLLTNSAPRLALEGAANARVTLLAGFTTVRNVGEWGWTDTALRDAINDGDVPGPRMQVSGPAVGITGGHCDINELAPEFHVSSDSVADGIAAVQKKVREEVKHGADLIKVCVTGGIMSKGDDPRASQFTYEELKAIVADAHRLGRKVAGHAHGSEGIRWAAEVGFDSIEHGSFIDDAGIALMKQHGTYLVPTLYPGEWLLENGEKVGLPPYMAAKARQVLPQARKNIAHAIGSGVKIAFGTDASNFPHGLNAHEFPLLLKVGMTPLAAIQAATLNAADLLGWSDRVGGLEPGKYADVIAVDGDPLNDITTLERVKFVMKGGEVVKNEYH